MVRQLFDEVSYGAIWITIVFTAADTDDHPTSALRQWSILEDNGQLDAAVNGYRKLLTTVSVNSSSLAAVLVTGRSASGPNSWHTESGKTLRELLG